MRHTIALPLAVLLMPAVIVFSSANAKAQHGPGTSVAPQGGTTQAAQSGAPADTPAVRPKVITSANANRLLSPPRQATPQQPGQTAPAASTATGRTYTQAEFNKLSFYDQAVAVYGREAVNAAYFNSQGAHDPAAAIIAQLKGERGEKLKAAAQQARTTVGSGTACESGHWIEGVMSDGEFVKLEDGSLWKVVGGDEITSALWLPTTEIVVCNGKLLNTDDNESIEAERIR
jgi:hypothetical protein